MVRTGYKDSYRNDDSEFENQLVYNLAKFIQTEGQAPWVQPSSEMSLDGRMTVMGTLSGNFASESMSVSLNSENPRALPAYCSEDSVEVSISLKSEPNLLINLQSWLHSKDDVHS